MRPAIPLALVLGLAASAYATSPSTSHVSQLEPRPMHPYENPGVRVQGDTVEDPVIVDAVPFSATGTTCGFNNDYDHSCPYPGSTSPDVVYRWTATGLIAAITIDLCSSILDTKVYVYEDAVGTPIACNDDYCAWQSYLAMVPVTAGHDYFIVVDGYGGDCGVYDLRVFEHVPCVIECPPGAMPEGEPDCYDGYIDQYNAGCSMLFPKFQGIEPSCDPIVICGTTGVFMFGSLTYRDSDWFELNLAEGAYVCFAGDAEIPAYYMIIDGRSGCSGLQIAVYEIAGPCAPMSGFCPFCDTGTWWMWVGSTAWDLSYTCGSIYWMEITGYVGGPSPAASTTWGTIKELFR